MSAENLSSRFVTQLSANQAAQPQTLARLLKSFMHNEIDPTIKNSKYYRRWSDCAHAQADLYFCCTQFEYTRG